MYKQRVIRKIVAASMLVLFAFSITPVIVFHNWLAKHTDSYKKTTDIKGQQLGKQTFNCHCDHIVAESPFTEPGTFTGIVSSQSFMVAATVDIVQIPVSPIIFYSLRGPPAVS
ncbi:MAG: hypothetical protein ACKOU7_00985 [Ferruginibacter sp.]